MSPNSDTGELIGFSSFSQSQFVMVRSDMELEQTLDGDRFGIPFFDQDALDTQFAKFDQPLRPITEDFHLHASKASRMLGDLCREQFTLTPMTKAEFVQFCSSDLPDSSVGEPRTHSSKIIAVSDIGPERLYDLVTSGMFECFVDDQRLVFKACAKDELRAFDEFGNPKPARIFMCDSLLSWATGVILFKACCNKFYYTNRLLHNRWETNPILCGSTPFHGGWQYEHDSLDAIRKFLRLPDEWESIDISGCDTKFHSGIFLKYIACHFTVPERFRTLFEAYLRLVFTGCFVDEHGAVFSRLLSMPSGVFVTSLFTSLYTWLLVSTCLSYVNPSTVALREWPRRLLGDDNLFAWPSKYGSFYSVWSLLVEPVTGQSITNEHYLGLEHQPLIGSQILSMRFVRQNGFVVFYTERPNRALARMAHHKKGEKTEQMLLGLLVQYWYHPVVRRKILDMMVKLYGAVSARHFCAVATSVHGFEKLGGFKERSTNFEASHPFVHELSVSLQSMSSTTTTTTKHVSKPKGKKKSRQPRVSTTKTVVVRPPPKARSGQRPGNAGAGQFVPVTTAQRSLIASNPHFSDLFCAGIKLGGIAAINQPPIGVAGEPWRAATHRANHHAQPTTRLQGVFTNNPTYPMLLNDLGNDPATFTSPVLTASGILYQPDAGNTDLETDPFDPLGRNQCVITPDALGQATLPFSLPLRFGDLYTSAVLPIVFPTYIGGSYRYDCAPTPAGIVYEVRMGLPGLIPGRARLHAGYYDATGTHSTWSSPYFDSGVWPTGIVTGSTIPAGTVSFYLNIQFVDLASSFWLNSLYLRMSGTTFTGHSSVHVVTRGTEFIEGIKGLYGSTDCMLAGLNGWMQNNTPALTAGGTIVAGCGPSSRFVGGIFSSADEISQSQNVDAKRMQAREGIVFVSTPVGDNMRSRYTERYPVDSSYDAWTICKFEMVAADPQSFSYQGDFTGRNVFTNVCLRSSNRVLGSTACLNEFYDKVGLLPGFMPNEGHLRRFLGILQGISGIGDTAVKLAGDWDQIYNMHADRNDRRTERIYQNAARAARGEF